MKYVSIYIYIYIYIYNIAIIKLLSGRLSPLTLAPKYMHLQFTVPM